jgi:orotate phosphoribosyltransferase
MSEKENSSIKVAKYLLEIKAVKLEVKKPFKWASGWNSPIYCDNRKTLSFPQVRGYLRDCFVKIIKEEYPNTDIIAGVATGGIALAALVSQELNLPLCYVRAKAKGHGLTNTIEGEISKGNNVVVLEDLISTGGSSLKAVASLREAECNVLGMLAIFSYGFKMAEDNFNNNSCDLHILSDYNTLVEQAEKMNYITYDDVQSLKDWRKSPNTWKKC